MVKNLCPLIAFADFESERLATLLPRKLDAISHQLRSNASSFCISAYTHAGDETMVALRFVEVCSNQANKAIFIPRLEAIGEHSELTSIITQVDSFGKAWRKPIIAIAQVRLDRRRS